MFFIGDFRRFFFIEGSWKWNGWVREVSAYWEGTWLIRSER